MATSAFLGAEAPAAAEPPCHIPTCMGEIAGAGKARNVLTSADGKSELRIVSTDGSMVLVELVKDGTAMPIQPTFVITTSPTRIELVPFGGDLKRPLVVFGGPWTAASSVELGAVTLTQNAKASRALDARKLFTRYKAQRQHALAEQEHAAAAEELARNMGELNRTCITTITHAQDWSKLPDAFFEKSMQSAAHVCEDNFYGAIVTRCAGPAGPELIGKLLKHVKCVYKPAGGLVMKLTNDGTLTIELSLSADREAQGSKAQRYLQPRL